MTGSLDLRTKLARALESGHANDMDHALSDERGFIKDLGSLRSAAVLIAITDRPEPGVILVQRPDYMRSHPGQVAFPGGKIDPEDKDAIQAALREAEEEVSLDPKLVDIIGPTDRYHTGSQYKMAMGTNMRNLTITTALSIVLIACSNGDDAQASKSGEEVLTADISPVDRIAFEKSEITTFDEPWAMTFLPDGRMLVTEKKGKLLLVDQKGVKTEIGNVPTVDYGGQGGFGDIVLAPDFATSNTVYLSWIEEGADDTRGAVVAHATLDVTAEEPALQDLKTVWTQNPKVTGKGHYSHRIVFSPDGKYMFIGSGERQKFDPAQDMTGNLGKIVRLFPDGTVPKDNPFVDEEGALPEIWSLGHRNILGIAFDGDGKLWNQEMGPRDGDELNLVQRSANYGYPIVSEGDHYDGKKIPNHDTRPEFAAPKVAWVPTIAPSGLIFYSGDLFPAWKGSAFIGGLASEAIIRVSFDGDKAKEAERLAMDARIREIEQGPEGALWVLEDGEGAKLLKLTPANP